ncbi:MAG TPA: phytanoyl-CoA dioxygenase family protein [Steroidobacteraceae bacterium]|nr:phytanoyl-CoA dioxygenase family protein [Steroidobacteraceae bacterium]
MSTADMLTAGEIENAKREYASQGYFVLPNVVSPQRLAELHEALAREFDKASRSGALFSGGGLLSGHLNCFPGAGARFVYETLQARGIIDLIKQLHPGVTRMPNVGCNVNLPGSHPQHYHIDRPFKRDFMIVNIAVVDTVIDNGAIELVPATHKRFYKYTQFVLKQCHRAGVRVPANRGDVLVRSSNVWHRGMTNQTSVPRPMLALTWEDGGSSSPDPFSAYGGNIRFLPNWFKPTRAGRFREQLFVRLPVAYSALRFARSLFDSEY